MTSAELVVPLDSNLPTINNMSLVHRGRGGEVLELRAGVGGVTPLMAACQEGHERTVRQILNMKPSMVHDRDRTGKTALHYCTDNPTLACIDQVVAADPSLLSAQEEDGHTPLHLATIAGNGVVAKYLITRGADVNALDREKHTAIHWATVCGEEQLLDLLIEAGGNPSTADVHGAYPIHYAAQMCGPNGDPSKDMSTGLRILRKLIQHGVPLDVRDRDQREPLLWAASSGSADAIMALKKAKVNIESADKDGLTALHCAASRGHLDCIDMLITFCNSEVDLLDTNGCSPLFYAVTVGHADCTKLLLNNGADPNRQDRKGRTPAHCGAAKGQLETLKLLHQHNADLWKKNVKGDLPLHEACHSGRKDLVVWLLSMMPDMVNAANSDGRTPLHIAAITSNTGLCKILMDHKADVNPIMRNSRGQLLTPVDAAVARGHKDCAQYLQLHKATAAAKLTDTRALQLAMSKAMEDGSGDRTGATPNSELGYQDILLPGSASSRKSRDISNSMLSPSDSSSRTDLQQDTQNITSEVNIRALVLAEEKLSKDEGLQKSQLDESGHQKSQLQESGLQKSHLQEEYVVADVHQSQTNSDFLEESESSTDKKISDELIKNGTENSEESTAIKVKEKSIWERSKSDDENHLSQDKPSNESSSNVKNSPETKMVDSEVDDMKDKLKTGENISVGVDEREFNNDLVNTANEKEISNLGEQYKTEKLVGDEISHENVPKDENSLETTIGGDRNSKIEHADDKILKDGVLTTEKVEVDDATKIEDNDKKLDDANPNIEHTDDKNVDDTNSKVEDDDKEVDDTSSKIEQTDDKISHNDSLLSDKMKLDEAHDSKNEDSISNAKSETLTSIKNENEASTSKDLTKGVVSDTNPNSENSSASQMHTKSKESKSSTTREDGDGSSQTSEHTKEDEIEKMSDVEEKTESPSRTSSETNTSNLSEKNSESENMTQDQLYNLKLNPLNVVDVEINGKIIKKVLKSKSAEEEDYALDAMSNKLTKRALYGGKLQTIKEMKHRHKAHRRKKGEIKGHEFCISGKADHSVMDAASFKFKVEFNVRRQESGYGGSHHGDSEIDFEDGDEAGRRLERRRRMKKGGTSERDFRSDDEDSGGGELGKRRNGGKYREEGDSYDGYDAYEDMENLPKHLSARRSGRTRAQGPDKVNALDDSLNRRGRIKGGHPTEMSITQAMQTTMRKYTLERRLFQQLLELKRQQIRNSKVNETVQIRRMADANNRDGAFLGLRGYGGPMTYQGYEKYLYDQLRFLQSNQIEKVPHFKPMDDVEKLNRVLQRSEIAETKKEAGAANAGDNEEASTDAKNCSRRTHRCHHAAHAYTGVPCAAYIPHRRKKLADKKSPHDEARLSLPQIGSTNQEKGRRARKEDSNSTESSIFGTEEYDPQKPLTVELKSRQGTMSPESLQKLRFSRTMLTSLLRDASTRHKPTTKPSGTPPTDSNKEEESNSSTYRKEEEQKRASAPNSSTSRRGETSQPSPESTGR